MKKIILSCAIICLFLNSHLAAQTPNTIRIKGGEEISKAIPVNARYRYPGFMPGNVTYTNSKVSRARLNYNLLLGEIQFIDPKGDTLSLDNEYTLDHIVIGKEVFYYDSQYGYLEIITAFQSVELARKDILALLSAEKEGAYGQSTAVSAIKNYNSYSSQNGQVYKLTSKGDVVLSREVSYYLMDQNKRFHKATKARVLKVFARHKKAVEVYLQEQPVDFNKEEDLKKLLQFCSRFS